MDNASFHERISKMNSFLTVFALVVIGASFCDGQCYVAVYPTPGKIGTPPQKGCYRDGTFMNFNTQVTEKCTTCYCSAGGLVSCCADGFIAVNVPDDCQVVPAKGGCGDKVVKLDNENEDCDYGYTMVSRFDLQ